MRRSANNRNETDNLMGAVVSPVSNCYAAQQKAGAKSILSVRNFRERRMTRISR